MAGLGFISIDLLTNSVVADVFQGNKNRVLPYLIIGMAALAAAAALAVTGVRIRGGTPYADMSEIRRRARQNPAGSLKRAAPGCSCSQDS